LPSIQSMNVSINTMPFIEKCEVINSVKIQGVVSTIGGKGSGYVDGNKTISRFNSPYGVVVDRYDNVYVADSDNHRIRKISPNGDVITIAGSGVGGYADGEGTHAKFYHPISIAIDDEDNLFISDYSNNRIRKLSKQGMVSTIAGGSEGYNDGVGTHAKFRKPFQIVLDSNNNILIAEQFGHRIRKITPHGVVSTIAGNGVSGFKNGDASSAQFSHPRGIGLDQQGNLYVADTYNHQIRRITCSGNQKYMFDLMKHDF